MAGMPACVKVFVRLIMSELETHPCFTAKCSDYARIHLPVAPKCNMQCNYCLRKYSCVNESRPGVVARVMVPEALNK